MDFNKKCKFKMQKMENFSCANNYFSSKIYKSIKVKR